MVRLLMTLVLSLLTISAFAENRAPAAAPTSYTGITFAQYVAENANNPALSRKIAGHQTAFVDFSKAAIIEMPEQFQDSSSGDGRMPASVPSAAPAGSSVAPPGGFSGSTGAPSSGLPASPSGGPGAYSTPPADPFSSSGPTR